MYKRQTPNLEAVKKGAANLVRHIDNMKNGFGLPVVVAVSYTHLDVYKRQLQNSLRAAAAVGDAAGIAEVDDILVGKALAQLPHAGQAAKAAVEYADGTVIHAAFPSFPEPER